jgi:hypothetical protein
MKIKNYANCERKPHLVFEICVSTSLQQLPHDAGVPLTRCPHERRPTSL